LRCRDDAIDARLSSIGGRSGPDPATTPEAVIQVYAARAEWANEDMVIQLSGVGPVGMTYLYPADDPRKTQ
jgi:hypothetical protein